ncbi:MAG: hypothetical protein PVJ27_12015 [Candidatus Brocadiaceae bacterium]|jgi:Arc/MetJ-type ribon-helix-helix transcriptional regulator
MSERKVVLDPELYRRIEELVNNSGAFDSVDDYVNCVLSELFGRAEPREADEAEERRLMERLKQLGYME